MLLLAILLLDAAEAAPPQSPFSILPPMVMIAVLGYLLLVRPMQKEKRELQSLLASLRKNDEVVTSGGIIGVVAAIKEIKDKEDEVLLVIDSKSNTRIRILKSHIVRVLKEPEVDKEATKEGGA